uniref:Double-strand break repair protein MRE11 (Trinotate prediction) n=1 Tax=Henneguya salminicola TaxID=69463 RepID=A0A6G3MH66_HENSL
MLLGGDLFHENKPSRKIICQAIYLIRKYCFGKKTQKFQVLNLPDFNESDKTLPKFNIKDPNLNISIPLFSIHGNHDDPIGMEGLCSLDIFSNAGLVNYFGKIQSSEKISIKPVMFRKGDSNLSIYGLGSLKDSRLQKMFKANLVQAEPPPISNTESFNIFVLHQNRYKHNEESYIPEDILFEFLDLVFWGHEHECLIDPIQVKNKGYFLTQPGSSVITSLSKGESVTK